MRYILLLCVLLLLGCGNSKQRPTQHPDIADRTITITHEALSRGLSDTLQLGRMRQGEIIAKSIRLINGDKQPMVILREATSCGCTTASYSRKPIATDASSEIYLEFDSRGQMGWQMKLMEFYFANSDTPLKIYIDAEVE